MEKQFEIISVGGYLYAVDKEHNNRIGWKLTNMFPSLFKADGHNKYGNFGRIGYDGTFHERECSHLIASNNPSLTDIPQLPLAEQDVEQLAEEDAIRCTDGNCQKNNHSWDCCCERHEEGFKNGYKVAQPKKYTEEDMIRFAEYFRPAKIKVLESKVNDKVEWKRVSELPTSFWLEQYIQSLRPIPKGVVLDYIFEIECHNYNGRHLGKDCSCKGGDLREIWIPKVDSNNQVIVRRWIWTE